MEHNVETKYVNFVCPSCKVTYEIFLKEIPYLMLMNCPHCRVAISCFEGEIRVATQEIVERIKYAKTYSDIKTVFAKFDKSELEERTKFSEKNYKYITQDDIVNLTIDLSLCKTFDDVMRVIDNEPCKK